MAKRLMTYTNQRKVSVVAGREVGWGWGSGEARGVWEILTPVGSFQLRLEMHVDQNRSPGGKKKNKKTFSWKSRKDSKENLPGQV